MTQIKAKTSQNDPSTLVIPCLHAYPSAEFYLPSNSMPQATTSTSMQDITAAEAAAKKRVQEAKEKSTKDVESCRTSEEERVEQKKTASKEEASKELKQEKESLGSILKEGETETQKQAEELKKKLEEVADAASELCIEKLGFDTNYTYLLEKDYNNWLN